MRQRGAIIAACALALAGCRTGDKRDDTRMPGDPVSRDRSKPSTAPRDPLTGGTSWLDGNPSARNDAVPPARTWAHPDDPNFDLAAETRGQLAGFVEDGNGRKIGNAHVRIEESGNASAKPFGVYTTPDGSFMLPGLKPGASYTITVEARDQDRTLVGRAVAKAPNVRLRIPVMEGELPKHDRRSGSKPDAKSPTGAIPAELSPAPLWNSGSRSSNDLPAPAPLERENNVYPPRAGSDLPGDWSPTDPAPNWNPAPPGLPAPEDPIRTIRPEMTTGAPGPDWKAPPATIPPRNESRKPAKGDQIPLVDTQGRSRTFPVGRPGELVLLDFMTTTCLPCQRMVPTLTAIQEKYAARGLDVVGVACDDESLRTRTAVAERYRKSHELNYRIYAEPAERPGPLLKRFNVDCYPTLVLVNSSGAVVWQGVPSQSKDLAKDLEAAIEANLGR